LSKNIFDGGIYDSRGGSPMKFLMDKVKLKDCVFEDSKNRDFTKIYKNSKTLTMGSEFDKTCINFNDRNDLIYKLSANSVVQAKTSLIPFYGNCRKNNLASSSNEKLPAKSLSPIKQTQRANRSPAKIFQTTAKRPNNSQEPAKTANANGTAVCGRRADNLGQRVVPYREYTPGKEDPLYNNSQVNYYFKNFDQVDQGSKFGGTYSKKGRNMLGVCNKEGFGHRKKNYSYTSGRNSGSRIIDGNYYPINPQLLKQSNTSILR
jgi:hypothetical protein